MNERKVSRIGLAVAKIARNEWGTEKKKEVKNTASCERRYAIGQTVNIPAQNEFLIDLVY